jgi:hypothetical protein
MSFLGVLPVASLAAGAIAHASSVPVVFVLAGLLFGVMGATLFRKLPALRGRAPHIAREGFVAALRLWRESNADIVTSIGYPPMRVRSRMDRGRCRDRAARGGSHATTKAIRLIVGSSAGGGDTFARVTAQALSNVLGQQVVIDNRAGAGSNIGADLVAKAPPDGYTLLFVYTGHVLNRACIRNCRSTRCAISRRSRCSRRTKFLLVNPASTAKSLTELIALAKKSPGKYTIGALPSSAQHQAASFSSCALASISCSFRIKATARR